MNHHSVDVDQAIERSPPTLQPSLPQLHTEVPPQHPLLAQITTNNGQTSITNMAEINPSVAREIMENSISITNTTNKNMDGPVQYQNSRDITGQYIMDVATSHISRNEDQTTYTPIYSPSPSTSKNLHTPMPVNIPNNIEDVTEAEEQDTDNESIIDDLVLNFTTEITIPDEITQDLNKDILPTTITNSLLTTSTRETNTPTPMAKSMEEINVQPIVRVAMMNFDFTPTPGEIYQVNNQGHLLRVIMRPGCVFQVNAKGALQEVDFPLPFLP